MLFIHRDFFVTRYKLNKMKNKIYEMEIKVDFYPQFIRSEFVMKNSIPLYS